MQFFKKIILAVLFSFSLFGYVLDANAAGKIENATAAEVKESIDNAVTHAEAALNAFNNGESKDAVLGHIKQAAQASKRIEVNRLDVLKTRTTAKLKKGRFAVKRDEKDKAVKYLTEAVEGFKKLQSQF